MGPGPGLPQQPPRQHGGQGQGGAEGEEDSRDVFSEKILKVS